MFHQYTVGIIGRYIHLFDYRNKWSSAEVQPFTLRLVNIIEYFTKKLFRKEFKNHERSKQ